MNNTFREVLVVAGCMLLAGASVAEPTQDGGPDKSASADVTSHAPTPPKPAKLDKRSTTRPANPHVGKEETKDLLRGKRPK